MNKEDTAKTIRKSTISERSNDMNKEELEKLKEKEK
jgi:hypothetical protein